MSSSNSWVGSHHLRPAAFVWICALALGVSELAADYKASYRAGIDAIDEGRWADAEAHMREAIREQPQEGGQPIKFYGGRWPPYLPHYHLGVALYRQGDCSGALDAWETSVRHGAIQGKEAKRLAQMRTKCQEQGLPAPPPPPSPGPVVPPPPPVPKVGPAELAHALEEATIRLDEAEDSARDLEALERDPDSSVLVEHSPGLAEAVADAKERIRVARDGLDLARTAEDIAAVGEAGRQAALAREELETMKKMLDRLREERALEAEAAEEARRREMSDLNRLSTDARQLVLVAAWDDTNVRRARKVLEELLRQTEPAASDKTTTQLIKLRERLSSAVESLRSALEKAPPPPPPLLSASPPPPPPPPPPSPPPVVPAVLRDAAQAFFSAEYSAVLEILEKSNLSLPREWATSRLLSAAARYSLFLEKGMQDTDLRAAAAADAISCQKLDPRLVPSPRFFSPEFVEFFRASRQL